MTRGTIASRGSCPLHNGAVPPTVAPMERRMRVLDLRFISSLLSSSSPAGLHRCPRDRPRRLATFSRLKCNGIGGNVRPPVLDAQRVLRRAGRALAGDHIFAGYWASAGFDPNLPVRLGIAKCQ